MSLKSRIEAPILQISNAKTSLRSALSNKGVSVPISPTWDQLIKAANHVEWRGGIMRLTKATAAAGGTKLTFQGNHVLISYNN